MDRRSYLAVVAASVTAGCGAVSGSNEAGCSDPRTPGSDPATVSGDADDSPTTVRLTNRTGDSRSLLVEVSEMNAWEETVFRDCYDVAPDATREQVVSIERAGEYHVLVETGRASSATVVAVGSRPAPVDIEVRDGGAVAVRRSEPTT
ncbi:hypothetical protein C475_04596 [Halosimplex carlsbadense 2-9-1]|uniref:Ig-like domain-containing protein n=1 Tax=Halosimplex carlsbadense 2-9-1 TaxID=797114 RepID=M0D2G4_9EURY|nr:hypothetical protein [Halosimplex carlsbadense]ELZ28887.1 hypothetical protein C475_04596 [Halosimplex carlsbadense 2-9-1]